MIMRLEMKFNNRNRNGVRIDAVFCYECSNTNYDKMELQQGKGTMIPIRKAEQKDSGFGTGHILYECIDCGYSFCYNDGYVNKYAIRQ